MTDLTQTPKGFRKIKPKSCKTCAFAKIGLEFYRGEFVDWKCEHPDMKIDRFFDSEYKSNRHICDEWEANK